MTTCNMRMPAMAYRYDLKPYEKLLAALECRLYMIPVSNNSHLPNPIT